MKSLLILTTALVLCVGPIPAQAEKSGKSAKGQSSVKGLSSKAFSKGSAVQQKSSSKPTISKSASSKSASSKSNSFSSGSANSSSKKSISFGSKSSSSNSTKNTFKPSSVKQSFGSSDKSYSKPSSKSLKTGSPDFQSNKSSSGIQPGKSFSDSRSSSSGQSSSGWISNSAPPAKSSVRSSDRSYDSFGRETPGNSSQGARGTIGDSDSFKRLTITKPSGQDGGSSKSGWSRNEAPSVSSRSDSFKRLTTTKPSGQDSGSSKSGWSRNEAPSVSSRSDSFKRLTITKPSGRDNEGAKSGWSNYEPPRSISEFDSGKSSSGWFKKLDTDKSEFKDSTGRSGKSSSGAGPSGSFDKSFSSPRAEIDKSPGRTSAPSGKILGNFSSGKDFSSLKREERINTAADVYRFDSKSARETYGMHKSQVQARAADGRRWGKNDAKAPIDFKKKFKKHDFYGGVSSKRYYGDHIYKQKIKIDIDFHGGHHYDYWPHSWYGWYHHNSHWPWYGYYYYDHSWHSWPSNYIYWYDDGYYSHYYYYAGHRHIYPRIYYQRCRADSFYFFVDLGDYRERYVPSYVIDYQRRLERQPVDIFDATDHVSRAYASFATRDYYNSVLSFHYAIRDYPDDGLLYLARAQAYAAIKDYRSAYEDIMHGMQLIPDWPEVRFNLAEIYSDPEETSRHLMALESWLETYPQDWRAHFVLGYFRFFLQDYESAKLELVYTLAHEPDHWQAQRMLDEIQERELEIELEQERY